jgi:hypothetical protein
MNLNEFRQNFVEDSRFSTKPSPMPVKPGYSSLDEAQDVASQDFNDPQIFANGDLRHEVGPDGKDYWLGENDSINPDPEQDKIMLRGFIDSLTKKISQDPGNPELLELLNENKAILERLERR